jgi:Cu+-exporting ATPase
MGNGSSVALTSADFCLLNSSLLGLITLQHISWLTIRKVLTNFGWAFAYNLILIPLAA